MHPRANLPSGTRWSGPFIVSGLAVFLGSWVLLGEAMPILGTLLVPHGNEGERSATDRALERHQDLMKTSRDRFAGRSLFVMPPPPERKAPPAPPPPPPRVEPVDPPPPLAPPATYTGSAPKGVIGTTVLFDTFSVRVGEEKNGIKVIGIEPPSNVKIEHMGGSYSVPIWTPTDWSKLGAISHAATPSGIQSVPSPAVAPEPVPEPVAELVPTPEPALVAEPAVLSTDPPASPPVVVEPPPPSPPQPVRPAAAASLATPYTPARAIAGPSSVVPPTAIPDPLTPEQIRLMSQAQVTAAIAQVSRARQQPGLDAATQGRLRQEFDLLRARRAELPR